MYYADLIPKFDGNNPPRPPRLDPTSEVFSQSQQSSLPSTSGSNITGSNNSTLTNESHLENPHQIQIIRNETSVFDPVQEVNNAWQSKSPSKVDASTSSATSNPWDGPPSPTNSNDSSETIKISNRSK